MGDDAAYVDLAAACSLVKKLFLHHHALVTNEGRNHCCYIASRFNAIYGSPKVPIYFHW